MTVQIGLETEDTRLASTRFMRGINIVGIPALAIPCGFTKTGLPIGLQLVGDFYREDLLLQVGAALEDATPLARKSQKALPSLSEPAA